MASQELEVELKFKKNQYWKIIKYLDYLATTSNNNVDAYLQTVEMLQQEISALQQIVAEQQKIIGQIAETIHGPIQNWEDLNGY